MTRAAVVASLAKPLLLTLTPLAMFGSGVALIIAFALLVTAGVALRQLAPRRT
jgi:hypothetical protein